MIYTLLLSAFACLLFARVLVLERELRRTRYRSELWRRAYVALTTAHAELSVREVGPAQFIWNPSAIITGMKES